MNEDIKYWIGLSKITGVGATRFKKLYSFFDTMKSAWEAPYDELSMAGLEKSVIQNIINGRREIDLDFEMEKLRKEEIQAVTIFDDNYPKLLKEIFQAPGVLYYKGKLVDPADEYAISIVGTRKYSQYGAQVIEKFVPDLARRGVVTVSGLALGIDSLVHENTVKYGARTISVLGSGLDRANIAPRSNQILAKRIIESGGLVVSEYPVGVPADKGTFPQRNRIIAGLSVATLVIEAPESSGALITTKYAIENNRDVLAVPGNISNINAVGCNNLIKMGAKLVSNVDDVLEALNMKQVKKFIETKKVSPDSEEERIILEIINVEPKHINEIIKISGMRTDVINSLLILMEMKGKVKNLGNMMYVIAR